MAKYDLSVLFRVIDKATGPLRKVSKSISNLSKPLVKATKDFQRLGKAASAAGKRMRKVGKDLSLKLTAPIVAFGGLSLRASMNFNRAMANVATLIPGNIKRVTELKDAVQDMAIRTGTATGIMADGLYQVISAFGDTSDTAQILEINAKAAAAGLATVTDAVNLTSAVMKGYGDVSEEAAMKSADLAFQAVKLGQTTFPELAASIGRVTPMAATLKVSQEELFASFATLTGVTGNAAEVSTQMAGVMRAMLKPTKDMKEAINALGYESAKAMLQERGLGTSMRALKKYAGGSEEALVAMFGRMEPIVAMFALTGKSADDYKKKLGAMNKSTGAMNEAFKEQTEGIGKAAFKWAQFTTRVSILSQKIGDALAPAFMKILEFLSPIVDWFMKLSPTTKTIIIVIAALAAAIGPLLIALGLMASGLGVFMAIATSLVGVVAILAAGFGAWVFVIYQVIKNWKFLINEIGLGVKFIIEKFKGLTKYLPEFIKKRMGFKAKVEVEGPTKEEQEAAFERAKQLAAERRGGSGVKGLIGAQTEVTSQATAQALETAKLESQTDINIKLEAEPGTTATVERVRKKKGDAAVQVATVGYLGAH